MHELQAHRLETLLEVIEKQTETVSHLVLMIESLLSSIHADIEDARTDGASTVDLDSYGSLGKR